MSFLLIIAAALTAITVYTGHSMKQYSLLRAADPLISVNTLLYSFYKEMIVIGGIIVIIAGFFSFLIVRLIRKPLKELKAGAEEYAKGNFDYILPVAKSAEFTDLVNAMNAMANQLKDRIRTILRERNEKDSILTNMVEGILTVDQDGRIISINQAAQKLFGRTIETLTCQSIHDMPHNETLEELVQKVLSSKEPIEEDLILHNSEDVFVQVHGSVVKDALGRKAAVLLVFNDVTRLQRLERVRQEFVANVSHELRTPITLIKGFVETLLEGALDNKEDALRFLTIIRSHSDRLNAIIEDLLSLSRLEQEEGRHTLEFIDTKLQPLLEKAVEICEPKADQRKISIHLDCDPAVSVRINPPLIQQAILNLLDNAVKYSPENRRLYLSAHVVDQEVCISVKDEGLGIGKEHLPHIFQRFYRIDKARSRDMGGTGLGLAIVKHIAQAHRGWVTVESELNKGTTFFVFLPKLALSDSAE
ncbi:two-component system histidine kinase PnpS [Thermoproteota archaeon]